VAVEAEKSILVPFAFEMTGAFVLSSKQPRDVVSNLTCSRKLGFSL